MKPGITTLLGAALMTGALAVQAQTAPAPAAGEPGKQRPTPEQRAKMKEAFQAAREACKDAQDKRGCMTQKMCAKAPDPAQCQARAKERHAQRSKHMDERQAAHEACTGKRGDELQKCLGERMPRHGRRPETKG
jgi:Spy/CpxP family protein refolding chaperone